ncbi:unnamed protein product [Lymnaea stagnalis]|uniref:Ig-like domain-containing protein n=1 Tax=Lymnaea stagnalis TaxID=6523 RepID=A0AAV2I2D2_LYMST
MLAFLATLILAFLWGQSYASVYKCETFLYVENKNLSVLCQFSGVDPGVRNCQLYWKRKDQSTLLTGTRVTTVPDSPAKFNVFCSVNLTVSSLGQGSHEFSAVLSPRTGVQARTQPVQVEFSLPEVSLNRDCYFPWSRVDNCLLEPLGYCTCDLTKAGYPAGRAEWFLEGALTNQERSDSSSRLVVRNPKTNTPVRLQKFVCIGTSALGTQQTRAEFEVKFPFGPTAMSLRQANRNGDNKFDLCPGKSEELNIECDVPVADVFPAPWFHFRVNDTIPTYNLYAGEVVGSVHRFQKSVRPVSGGTLNVQCQPLNSCSKRQVQDTISIQVREPPKALPRLVINGKSYNGSGLASEAIRNGDTVVVSCTIDGGVPAVSDVTLTCPGQTLTSRGNSVQLTTFRARRPLSGQSCLCSANHVTGCYSGRTDVVLNVGV